MTPQEYVYAIAELIADFDLGEEIFWHRGSGLIMRIDAEGKHVPDPRPLQAAVLCNDLFYWATSDLEDILEEDIPVLEATLQEVGDFYGGLLFVARKRKLRPMTAYLDRHRGEKGFPVEEFLAAGPERTRKDEG